MGLAVTTGPVERGDMTSSSRFTLRGPADLLAVVPFALGFEPEESLVLVTLGGGGLHARVDLPRTACERREVTATLLQAVRANDVQAAALLAYSPDTVAGPAAVEQLRVALEGAGVQVVEALRVEGERWWPILDLDGPGHPVDLRAHPFTVERVFAGESVHRSRADLEAWVRPDPDPAVAAALASRSRVGEADAETGWLRGVVASYDERGGPLPADDVARLLRVIAVGELRDHAWCSLTREAARPLLPLWREVTVRAPDEHRASAAACLALCAWLSGDGALAWIAVGRSREVDPGHTLAALVADLLEAAVSPRGWRPVDLGRSGDPGPDATG